MPVSPTATLSVSAICLSVHISVCSSVYHPPSSPPNTQYQVQVKFTRASGVEAKWISPSDSLKAGAHIEDVSGEISIDVNQHESVLSIQENGDIDDVNIITTTGSGSLAGMVFF